MMDHFSTRPDLTDRRQGASRPAISLIGLIPLVFTIFFLMTHDAQSAVAPVYTPVHGFTLERYLGTWYEIARMPNAFESDLVQVTATYSMRNDGMVKVENKGFREGKESSITGKAKFARSTAIGHLKVSFFWIFYADYIIVDLDSAYSHALVVSGKEYLWVLSRTPALDPSTVQRLIGKASTLGFDTTKIYYTPQDSAIARDRR